MQKNAKNRNKKIHLSEEGKFPITITTPSSEDNFICLHNRYRTHGNKDEDLVLNEASKKICKFKFHHLKIFT
jgi:hypothetical protein